ncbi:hypothetical protein [Kurthia gibsonii]|uniref:hypothetical protein n=1 Tax=Kurthia gibsonii TaxID=33946 RepID=UPI0030190BA9
MTKRKIKLYVQEYIDYSKKNNPFSNVNYDSNIIFLNNCFISLEIIDAYINSELIDNQYVIKLLKGFQENILLLLHIFPKYNSLIFSTIKRNIIETILRILITINMDLNEKQISSMRFVNLKDLIKKNKIYKLSSNKKYIDSYFQLFADNSNVLHNNFSKDSNTITKLSSLNNSLRKDEIKSLNYFSNCIKHFLLFFLPNKFHINVRELPMSSIKMIQDSIEENEFNNFFSPTSN